VFTRSDSGGIGFGGAGGLYLIDEAGGVPVPVMGASENNFANYYPRFSPNGMWIAYTLSMSAQSTISAPDAQIRLVKADNSGQVLDLPLLNGGASSYPTWSVNGQFLSFSSNRAGGQGSWDIYIAPIDPVTGQEGAAVNLAEANTSSFEHSAQWSP
jgi:Tol biopolymer transport system component